MPISSALRTLLALRDKRRCAYCLTTEENCGLRMHVDHIIPETAGGPTTEENLCLACFSCNTAKAAQQTAVDPHSGAPVSLFHPLRQRWSEHFSWDESQTQIIGCVSRAIGSTRIARPTFQSRAKEAGATGEQVASADFLRALNSDRRAACDTFVQCSFFLI